MADALVGLALCKQIPERRVAALLLGVDVDQPHTLTSTPFSRRYCAQSRGVQSVKAKSAPAAHPEIPRRNASTMSAGPEQPPLMMTGAVTSALDESQAASVNSYPESLESRSRHCITISPADSGISCIV